jgi:hypothetical protein
MRGTLACVVVLVASAAAGPNAQGARVQFRLESTISTETARAGDPVRLRTAEPIVIEGVSIPEGRDARGVITRSTRPGRVRGRGEIEIKVVSIVQPDGAEVPLTARPTTAQPPARRGARRPYQPRPAPVIPILAGMAAGYGTAMLVSRWSDSTETITRSGVVAGLATGVLVGVLKRGEDLVLHPGLIIDVEVERAARPGLTHQNTVFENGRKRWRHR